MDISFLKQLRDRLGLGLKDIDPEVSKRSAYNFIYGISLFSFLCKAEVMNKPRIKKGLSKIEKIKKILRHLQKNYSDLYCIDLPEYDKDDYTIKFDSKILQEVAQEVNEFYKNNDMSNEEFWKMQEEFFISSF